MLELGEGDAPLLTLSVLMLSTVVCRFTSPLMKMTGFRIAKNRQQSAMYMSFVRPRWCDSMVVLQVSLRAWTCTVLRSFILFRIHAEARLANQPIFSLFFKLRTEARDRSAEEDVKRAHPSNSERSTFGMMIVIGRLSRSISSLNRLITSR